MSTTTIIFIVIIAALVIFTIFRSKNGGNDSMIAKNIASIFVAVENSPSATELNNSQKCFIALALDMMTYLKSGQVGLGTVAGIVKDVAKDGEKSGEELVASVAAAAISYIGSHFEHAAPAALTARLQASKSNIDASVHKQLSAGIQDPDCKKWLPLVEPYITSPTWKEYLNQL